jgi:predicted aspartyl protease
VSAVKKVFVGFLCFWLVLLITPAGAQEQEIDAADATARAELPFNILGGFLIVVEGRIGTLSKLKFILDTGTTQTVVDKRVARKLGVHGLPSQVLAIQKRFDVESAIFSDLQLGPIQATNIPLLVADLAALNEFAGAVDGILGLDLLLGSRISIDFNSKKLLVSSTTADRIQSLQQDGIVCVTTTVQVQKHPVRLLVDTGMRDILFYEDRLGKRVPHFETGNVKLIKLGHTMFANKVMLQKIRIGTADIEHPETFLLRMAPRGFPTNIDGVLGTAVLKARWLRLDFGYGNLEWMR